MKKLFLLFLFTIISTTTVFAKDFAINLGEKLSFVNISYFEKYKDENLTTYILQAVENNHNAKIASYKSEEFRQNVKYSLGKEFPELKVGANYLGLKTPDFAGLELDNSAFILPFTASYELDYLLKNRDKTRALKNEYISTKFGEQGVYITLASDVATVYVNILKLNENIALQNEIVKAENEILLRAKRQYEAGVIDFIQYNNANKNLKDAQNNLEKLLINKQKLLTELALLIGESPNNTAELKFGDFDNFVKNINTPKEISSDAVFSRPDILAVEKKLAKAKIDVRVARKEFLPKLTINGVLAFSTFGGGTFFSWQSAVAALLAGASQDIFMGGRKIANLKMQKMKYEQVFEEYKQTDLTALKEVNDALYILKYDGEIAKKTYQQLNYVGNNYKRNVQKYKNGTISYPVLLEENISFLNMKQKCIEAKALEVIDNFTLYKAVGGNL